MEETGLSATIRVVGTHHKIDYDEHGSILEDKYLILVHGTNPQGEMMVETETHVNHWLTPQEYKNLDKRFGDIDETLLFIRGTSPFFSEAEYRYESIAY
jgi:hypothetical protein